MGSFSGTPIASNQYVWVSQRTSVNGTFGSFSTPSIFANFAADGAAGGEGDPGATGLRTVTGRVNFANSVANAPSAPTTTRLTFPDTFTSLTSNWSTATPTYASGNSNKYWYANYTATEDSSRPGYASTVTFGSVTQAIGFSGLVTFSGAAITDGTSSVTPTTAAAAAEAATTLIDAGGFTTPSAAAAAASALIDAGGFTTPAAAAAAVNANVTSINGGVISTGIIQSAVFSTTAGSQINISDGNMRFGGSAAPKFSVSNAGVMTATGVTVSGAITATSGTFTGDVTATGGAVGGWALAATTLSSTSAAGGGDGSNTTAGMIISSTGFISAPDFNISSSGVASFGTSAKIGTKPFSDLVEIVGSDLRIKDGRVGNFGSFTTRFSGYDAYDGRISTNNSSVQQVGTSFYGSSYDCVLSGTKVVTKRGEVNIEDTNLDDIIKVYNFLTGIWEWSTIKGIHNRVTDSGWSHIKTKMGYELKCSNTHAIYHPEYPNHAIKINELGVDGQLYVVKNGEIVKDYVESIKIYDEPIEVWNYHLDHIYNYISNGILSHNMPAPSKTTLGHHYVKRNNVSIESGDLVTLDSNNELIKTTNSKDSSVVGVLWKPIEEYVTDEFYTDSDITPPSELSEIRFLDSLSNILPIDERGVKSMWNVAAIGDSRDYNISNSEHVLGGFKVCNQEGDVSKGDLLCSSDTAGYLMKQPIEHVVIRFEGSTPIYEERQSQCSYTVAKCMENVIFDTDGMATGVYGYLYCG